MHLAAAGAEVLDADYGAVLYEGVRGGGGVALGAHALEIEAELGEGFSGCWVGGAGGFVGGDAGGPGVGDFICGGWFGWGAVEAGVGEVGGGFDAA